MFKSLAHVHHTYRPFGGVYMGAIPRMANGLQPVRAWLWQSASIGVSVHLGPIPDNPDGQRVWIRPLA